MKASVALIAMTSLTPHLLRNKPAHHLLCAHETRSHHSAQVVSVLFRLQVAKQLLLDAADEGLNFDFRLHERLAQRTRTHIGRN